MATFKKILLEGDVSAEQGIGIYVDAGEDNIVVSGVKARFSIPYDATITAWEVTGKTSGNVSFDVWKKAGEIPSVADSIVGDTVPSLSGQSYNMSSDMTNWTTDVTAGDVFTFYVNADSTLEAVQINLWVTKG